jgi:hypothetical protein
MTVHDFECCLQFLSGRSYCLYCWHLSPDGLNLFWDIIQFCSDFKWGCFPEFFFISFIIVLQRCYWFFILILWATSLLNSLLFSCSFIRVWQLNQGHTEHMLVKCFSNELHIKSLNLSDLMCLKWWMFFYITLYKQG